MTLEESERGASLVSYAIGLSLLLIVFLAASQLLEEGINHRSQESLDAAAESAHCLPGIPEGDERCL